ncbi:MAG TPA: hypothetical protein DCY88_33950 [Cyanobacteria bacterium UBA11372]|nr:hypothetical protein [Cyanobacteria bacterium UBA11372]
MHYVDKPAPRAMPMPFWLKLKWKIADLKIINLQSQIIKSAISNLKSQIPLVVAVGETVVEEV